MRKKMLWALLLVPLIVMSMVNISVAQPSEIYFTPEAIADVTLAPGSYITIAMGITHGNDIWGYQVELYYNPAVLHGVSVDDSGFLTLLGGTLVEAVGLGFDNVNGKLNLYGAALFEKDPAKCVDGGGILVLITFEVVGWGASGIHTGYDTGVANVSGHWIVHGGTPRVFFSNVEIPELYVRRRDAQLYEEWQVGLVGTEQTTYSQVMNYGEAAATIKVTFRIRGPDGIDTYISDEATIPAATAPGVPGSVVVSASFIPGPPGKYYVMAMLEFKDSTMIEFYPLGLIDDIVGGEGTSKDIKVAFKVVTHM